MRQKFHPGKYIFLFIFVRSIAIVFLVKNLLKLNILSVTMTMTIKINVFDINHLNTMIRKNKTEKNNVVTEQETIQNNIECRYRKPTPLANVKD